MGLNTPFKHKSKETIDKLFNNTIDENVENVLKLINKHFLPYCIKELRLHYRFIDLHDARKMILDNVIKGKWDEEQQKITLLTYKVSIEDARQKLKKSITNHFKSYRKYGGSFCYI